MVIFKSDRKAELAEAKRRYLSSTHLQKIPRAEAARIIGVGKTSIARWGIEAGIPTPDIRRDEEREKNVALMLASDDFGLKDKQSIISIPALSEKFSIPYNAVYKIQDKFGVSPMGSSQRRNPPGESYPLTHRHEDLEMVQLAKEWHRPKGMTEHLESLDVHK